MSAIKVSKVQGCLRTGSVLHHGDSMYMKKCVIYYIFMDRYKHFSLIKK